MAMAEVLKLVPGVWLRWIVPATAALPDNPRSCHLQEISSCHILSEHWFISDSLVPGPAMLSASNFSVEIPRASHHAKQQNMDQHWPADYRNRLASVSNHKK